MNLECMMFYPQKKEINSCIILGNYFNHRKEIFFIWSNLICRYLIFFTFVRGYVCFRMEMKDVIRALRVGNKQVFEQVFEEYSQVMFFTAMGLVGDKEVAENAVQDTFLYLWEHRKRLDENGSLVGFLHIRLKHYALNYLRHEKIKVANQEGIIRELEFLNEDEEDFAPLLEEIRCQIEVLPENCRKIFVMAVVEGMSYVDTARALDVSVNTVKSQVKIAYRKIKEGVGHRMSAMNLLILLSLLDEKLF